MLKQRVLTALVLAAAFLSLLFLAPWYLFAAGVGIVLCVAVWEWSALAGWKSSGARAGYFILSVLIGLAVAWWLERGANLTAVRTLLIFACGWWALALLWIQGYPSSAILWRAPVVRSLMGWLVLLPAWCGLLFLHQQTDGPVLILLVVLLVACADIGAYFCGRAFGRHKLAPSVSPAKSWEGVVGGLAVAVIVALIANAIWLQANGLLVTGIVVPTVLVSVLGDLLESMVKRYCGVKDSGQILPGHGGIFDRIDGLTAALPVFALALIVAGFAA